MARRGFLSRISDALQRAVRPIERFFEGEPRRAAPREPTPPRPPGRGAPPRQPPGRTEPPRRRRGREHDPWEDPWRKGIGRRYRTSLGHKPEYQANADFVKDMAYAYNISVDEQEDFWKDYIKYMVKGESRYRMSDLRNPFWQNWNIHPDDFDWWEWREAMGYPHGARGK